ncbi:MFS transporter, partial [Bacillus cereus]|uniref:MFS transporter n=1 Tax=Bacillus cereus TaxID=1396 RepID=UPI000BEE2039
ILLTITFCIDLLLALYGIADVSIIPEIVDKKDLPKANSYMQMSLSVATSIGPSLAGGLLMVLGLFNSLWITFLGFMLLICSIRLVTYNNQIESIESNPKSIFKKSFEGIKYTWSNRLYRT